MPTSEQLRLRALRILHDGKRHSADAICWAMDLTGERTATAELRLAGFTLREISLGAGEVVSL
jgi:hypothetical protein